MCHFHMDVLRGAAMPLELSHGSLSEKVNSIRFKMLLVMFTVKCFKKDTQSGAMKIYS